MLKSFIVRIIPNFKSVIIRTIKVDDFTRRMWNIYETVRKEGISQVKMLQFRTTVNGDVALKLQRFPNQMKSWFPHGLKNLEK